VPFMSTLPVSLSNRLTARWPWTAAGVTALLAAIGLLAGVLLPSPRWEVLGPLSVDPGPVGALSHVLAAATGVGLLFVARGLWRGSRRAAQVAAATLGAVTLVGALNGGAPLAVAAQACLAILLVARFDAFPRGAASRAPRAPGAVVAGVAGMGYGLGVAALLVGDRVTGLGAGLQQAGGWLATGQWWLHDEAPLAIGLDGAVLATLAAAAWWLHALLRPGPAVSGHSADEHAAAAALVAAHAQDSLDAFALREDKSYFFAHDGLLAYRVLGETAVVSGDPIGPIASAPRILADFEVHAAAHGWDVVLTAASQRDLEGYRERGFRDVCIGEEAVVDAAAFSLEGSTMKTVRKAVRRVARLGWTVEVRRGHELAPDTVVALARIEREWRSTQPRLQGFAMTLGRLWGAREDEDALYVLGRAPEGTLTAFLRFTPYPTGMSLDIMRRTGAEPNGINEALIVAAIENAHSTGLTEVSLNFAGFSHLMAPRGPLSTVQRIARHALGLAHGRFQLDRLASFNEKFGPRWEPRYLVFRGALGLPRAGLRVLQAEAYVRAPRDQRRRDGWQPLETPAIRMPGGAG